MRGRQLDERPEVGISKRKDLPLAVVVGAGGMGMAIARRLGQSRRLLLLDRDASHLERQRVALCEAGYDAQVLTCDVTDAEQVSAAARRAAETGPLAVLANVVGLSPSMGNFRALMQVNLIGASRVAEAMRPRMAPGGCGLFVSSSAGHMLAIAPELQAILDHPLEPDFLDRLEEALSEEASSRLAYQLAKASINRMCQRLALAWGEQGARIISLSPGLIVTPMGALEFDRMPAKYDLLASTPIRREGTMLEIAEAAEFLCSDRASFISGTDLLVDGGLTGTLKTGAKSPV